MAVASKKSPGPAPPLRVAGALALADTVNLICRFPNQPG